MTPLLIFPELLTENTAPELMALKGKLQNPQYHPEGDAYVHTLAVYNVAHDIATRDGLDEVDTNILALAALCHDFGKATHTFWSDEKQTWTSPGHDVAGEEPTRAFLTRHNVKPEYQERIVCLVREHMVHVYLQKDAKPSKKLAAGLLDRIEGKTTLEELQRLVEADKSGRPPLPKHVPATFLLLAEVCREVVEERRLKALEPEPFLTGKELLELNVPQGPAIGTLLKKLAELQKDGSVATRENAIDYVQQVEVNVKKIIESSQG